MNRNTDAGGWAARRKKALRARKRRAAPQKRILLLAFTIAVLFFTSNLNETRQSQPVLRGLDLDEAARLALFPDAPNANFELFSYQTDAEEPWLQLACYSLNPESGQWQYLRGGELRLEGQNGKLALRFDGENTLWAAFFNERDECFAEMNPDEAAHGLQYTSAFWWRKERTPLTEGQEFVLAVQTVFLAGAPEDAVPIDPRDAHDPALLQNRAGVAGAYALTLQITDGVWRQPTV